MAVYTGTATNFKDLLADLIDAAADEGWTVIDYDSDADPEVEDVVFLQGPGVSDDDGVFVQIKTFGDTTTLFYGWRIRAAINYSSGLDFENQPGVSPQVILNLDNASIDYTFYISNRRIVVIARISTFVMSAYMGFFNPFATPLEYPYPLLVAAPSSSIKRYTTVATQDRGIGGPGEDSAHVRTPSGDWQRVWNHGTGNSPQAHFDDGAYYLWPQYNGITNSFFNVDIRPLEVPQDDNFYPMWPIHIFGDGPNAGVLGVLEDVFFGHNAILNTHDTVTVGADTYTIYQTLNRAGISDFFYIREA